MLRAAAGLGPPSCVCFPKGISLYTEIKIKSYSLVLILLICTFSPFHPQMPDVYLHSQSNPSGEFNPHPLEMQLCEE